jgi:hypothetical protein
MMHVPAHAAIHMKVDGCFTDTVPIRLRRKDKHHIHRSYSTPRVPFLVLGLSVIACLIRVHTPYTPSKPTHLPMGNRRTTL